MRFATLPEKKAPAEDFTAGDLRPLPLTVEVLRWRGRLLEKNLGKSPSAAQLRACVKTYELGAAVLEHVRQETLESEASKMFHGAAAFDLFPLRIGMYQRLFALDAGFEHLQAAFTTAEQGTARVFLEALGRARAHSLGNVDPDLREREAELLLQGRRLEDRLAEEQNKSPDKRNPERIGRLLEEQKANDALLKKVLTRMERDYPQYKALKYPTPCTLAQARACLSAKEVALLYVLGEDASYVVVVEPDADSKKEAGGLSVVRLPPAAEIADKVAAMIDVETLANPAHRALGGQIHGMLLAPLADKIRDKDLVIVPGGTLCHFPFELIQEKNADGEMRYLIENHRVRYAPSLTVLHLVHLWKLKRAAPDQPLWALGDPIYDAYDTRCWTGKGVLLAETKSLVDGLHHREGAGKNFARLVHSRTEIQRIADVLKATKGSVFLDKSASESNIKQASASGRLARTRYVHLATHGILGFDIGRQPSLVLSLVGNDKEDGFLQLDEVTSLKLNADLVVLSACRTGQGRMHHGEGVTGLARAFLYAGSKGVVCSLWSVDDRETADLMVDLYGHLGRGSSAADALREARLAMIRAGQPHCTRPPSS